MSTDTPVQKDEPNASAEQQSAPVQPVSEEPVAPVTETAARIRMHSPHRPRKQKP